MASTIIKGSHGASMTPGSPMLIRSMGAQNMPAYHKLYAMMIFLPKVSVAMKHDTYTDGHGQEEGK